MRSAAIVLQRYQQRIRLRPGPPRCLSHPLQQQLLWLQHHHNFRSELSTVSSSSVLFHHHRYPPHPLLDNNNWGGGTSIRCFAAAYGGGGSLGRVVMYQRGKQKYSLKGGVKLCAGCGCQILSGGGGRGSGGEQQQQPKTQVFAGFDAVTATEEQIGTNLTKKQEKRSRFMDMGDDAHQSKAFCDRCKALQSANIWKAYDAIRDVTPEVFTKQLKFVVNRRRFGMGIVVMDATDSTHSVIPSLRRTVGKMPLIGVWNKVDLMPRFESNDQKTLEQACSMRFISSFPVSAKTGKGVADLAEYLLEELRGKDVFVLGAANVGKSTLVKALSELIAQSVYLKGYSSKARARREKASSLRVTGSHLPGTTLQALRIPCFPSKNHALWDTPGILSGRALQYRIFPAHLMEPLTRPGRIDVPTLSNGKYANLRPGETLLIESTWMSPEDDYENFNEDDNEEEEEEWSSDENGDDDNDKPKVVGGSEQCVLARIDMVDIHHHSRHDKVLIQAYLHPSLRMRIVPTSEAPDDATIPTGHIRRIQEKIRRATRETDTGINDDGYSFPLKVFPRKGEDSPNGELKPGYKEQAPNGKHFMDVVFASLGWIAFCNDLPFTVIPHCVEGSVFSKRKSLYPVNMQQQQLDHNNNQEEDNDTFKEKKNRLRLAARIGRHQKDLREKKYGWYDNNERGGRSSRERYNERGAGSRNTTYGRRGAAAPRRKERYDWGYEMMEKLSDREWDDLEDDDGDDVDINPYQDYERGMMRVKRGRRRNDYYGDDY